MCRGSSVEGVRGECHVRISRRLLLGCMAYRCSIRSGAGACVSGCARECADGGAFDGDAVMRCCPPMFGDVGS